MTKNHPLTPFIAHTILKLAETGNTNILKKRYIEPEPNCKPVRAKGNPLGIEKFVSLFALYSIGCFISLIVLVMEKIYEPSKFEETFDEDSIIKIEGIEKEMQSLLDEDLVPLHLQCKVKRLLIEVGMLKNEK